MRDRKSAKSERSSRIALEASIDREADRLSVHLDSSGRLANEIARISRKCVSVSIYPSAHPDAPKERCAHHCVALSDDKGERE